jgi:hypothetical protein
MTERVLKTLEPLTFHGSAPGASDALQDTGSAVTLDVGAKLREMW